MALHKALLQYLEERLSQVQGRQLTINSVSTVSGGSINQAYCLFTNNGKLIIKLNSKSAYPDMFAAEARGLNIIGDTRTINVPEVILQGGVDDQSFLVLEWIETHRPTDNASEKLGQHLATLHRSAATSFGLDHDNYMGSMRQGNRFCNTWAKFFIEQRLQPMVKAAVDTGRLNAADLNRFETLYNNLGQLFDEEPPSLIHGDLWSGNYLIAENEVPYLIDPAVSYGNREFDIAMTTLFGGFSPRFYQAYNESFKLNEGWQQRLHLWNLYPLLLHLNLFGTSYLGQVRDCLNTYL